MLLNILLPGELMSYVVQIGDFMSGDFMSGDFLTWIRYWHLLYSIHPKGIRCRGGLVVAGEIVVDNFFDENGESKKLSRWKSCRFLSNPFSYVNTTPPLMSWS